MRVNAIICGTFDTDTTAAFVRDHDLLPAAVAPIAVHRVGQATEVVRAALYLASAASSSYTAGSLITIDGGVAP